MIELLRAADVPTEGALSVCRHPPARVVIVAAVAALGGAALVGYGLRAGSVLSLYLGGLTLLALLIFRRLILAVFRPSNWLLRADVHGVFVQFRSYLNHRLSVFDRTVAFFPYESITFVRSVTERQDTAERDVDDRRMVRTYVQAVEWLELRTNASTRELAAALEVEEARRPATGALYRDYPVRMSADGVIQVRWDVTPSVETFFAAVGNRVTTGPPATIEVTTPSDGHGRPT